MPRKISVRDAAIQQLSPALGSETVVTVAALGLEALAAVVSVAVVVVTVLVAAAGFCVGFVEGSAAGSPVAGSVPGADGTSPGTSGPAVSPAGAVASTGSIVTCAATDPSASTTPPAPKAPPAGATKRADASDPPRQATPPSAPDASSQDAWTVSCPPATPPAAPLGRHTPKAHALPGARTRGDNAPSAANGKTVRDHAGHPRIRDAVAVGPRLNLAAVHRERPRHVDPALRARGHQRPGTVERQIAPHLHAATRDVHVGRARLDNSVLPGQRHHQVAVGADGLARVAVKLQMVGIGPSPSGARHARLVVRGARDEQALRARGIRRPAQQNAKAGHGSKQDVATAGVERGSKHNRSDLRKSQWKLHQ